MRPKLAKSLFALFTLVVLGACSASPLQTASKVEVRSERGQTADGVWLFAETVGSGEQVIIIPNGHFMRDHFGELASARRTLIFFDLRNRGRSNTLDDAALLAGGILNDVSDIEAIRQHSGASTVSIVGHSYLGLAAALYAAEYPNHVEKLVMIGPMWHDLEEPLAPAANGPQRSDIARNRRQLAALSESGLAQSDPIEYCRQNWAVVRTNYVTFPRDDTLLGDDFCVYSNEWPRNVSAFFQNHIVPSIAALDIDDSDLARIDAPTLIAHGKADRVVPFGAASRWAQAIAGSLLRPVEHGGHMPWIEDPSIIKEIDRFLADRQSTQTESRAKGD